MNPQSLKKQLVDSIPATANPATFKQVGLMFALILVVGTIIYVISRNKCLGGGCRDSGLPTPKEN
ncbi:MAG: hypothetical protein CM1200mP10_14470 [Candidatus Neomarinimicrobiota bacterium]|nr:MAG: hypothetical protein CM1200mP10_14470 [Candidatus Neomarinimicrobiota bacterium]